jgi:hypothetical protein
MVIAVGLEVKAGADGRGDSFGLTSVKVDC